MTVYEVITSRIIEMLEQGVAPWRRPWRTAAAEPRNLVSGKPYRGINALLLAALGWRSPWFLTYRQAAQRGGNIKRGAKGFPVIFWKCADNEADEESEKTDRKTRKRLILRYSTVFSSEQCEGVEIPAVPAANASEPIAECERVIREMRNPPRIEHGGTQAFYRPSTDTITLPHPEQFESRELYYSVLWHEAGHASGAASRLARKGITDATMFSDHLYSVEEIIAECTAAFLCGATGIEAATLQDSTAYLANWIKVLKGDARLIITAAGHAQRAADLILGRQ
jgi:antirestriction protein ArdC